MNKRKCRNDCEALIERRHSCDDGTSRSSWSVTAKREPFRLVDLTVFCSTNPQVIISSRIFEREQREEESKKNLKGEIGRAIDED